MDSAVSFTPARFNTGVNEAEKTIVTSTGKYVVTWNFRRLKQGRTDDYSIKQYDSRVVADNFKFGADKNIIVALEHNVIMANKKDLAKVSQQSGITSAECRLICPAYTRVTSPTAHKGISIHADEEDPRLA